MGSFCAVDLNLELKFMLRWEGIAVVAVLWLLWPKVVRGLATLFNGVILDWNLCLLAPCTVSLSCLPRGCSEMPNCDGNFG